MRLGTASGSPPGSSGALSLVDAKLCASPRLLGSFPDPDREPILGLRRDANRLHSEPFADQPAVLSQTVYFPLFTLTQDIVWGLKPKGGQIQRAGGRTSLRKMTL